MVAATGLFLRDGYAATSMEAVAAAAGVSKRTLYARFPGKSVLLQAALERLIRTWLPTLDSALEQAASVEEALLLAAPRMLAIALTPQALSLFRLIVAEAGRIPGLGQVLHAAGAGAGVARIAALLEAEGVPEPRQAAEQFQRLVVSGPQLRALGLGPALTPGECEAWARQAVTLFLHGVRRPEA